MDNEQKLSNVTELYIRKYNQIIDTLINETSRAPLSRSISSNFITQIIFLQQASIEMAKNILKYTICIPLQNIALNIIKEQTRNISTLKNITADCRRYENRSREIMYYQKNFNQIFRNMISKSRNLTVVNSVDQNFVSEIILHYECEIKMFENLLRFKIHPELRKISQHLVVFHKNRIKEINSCL